MYCQKADDDLCDFCGRSDSRFHRFWVCPAFQPQRDQVPSDVLALIPGLPEFLTGYGWAIRPCTTDMWSQVLNSVAVLPLVVEPSDDVQ